MTPADKASVGSHYLSFLVAGVILGLIGGQLAYVISVYAEFERLYGANSRYRLQIQYWNPSHVISLGWGAFVGVMLSAATGITYGLYKKHSLKQSNHSDLPL